MKFFIEMLQETKQATSIQEKAAMLSVCVKVIRNPANHFSIAEKQQIYEFAFEEIKPLEEQIEAAKTYEEKDNLFNLADKLVQLIIFANCTRSECTVVLMKLLDCVHKNRVLENAVDEMFSKGTINLDDVKIVLEKAMATTDVYEKGKFYIDLIHYEKEFDKFDKLSKELMTKFLNKETLESVLNFENLNKYQKESLGVLCELLRLYNNKDTVRILKTAVNISDASIAFYSEESLMELGEMPSQSIVDFLAKDIFYAGSIYDALEKHGHLEMFPKELRSPEYLAKSDMINWLYYPFELGEMPTEIELIGKIKKHHKEFHVFKFKTTSKRIPKEKHNIWLVGLSGKDLTFSNYEPLSNFEMKTTEKTLKQIAKRSF